MAIIWLIMLCVSLGLMLFTDPAAAVGSMVDGAHGAVELSLNLLALYAFWLGFFSLIEKLGLSQRLEKLLRPVISRLFPSCDAETRKYITMNMSANLLGLGNAATPMAITAINRMDNGDSKASTDMIMLTVISATSLQLLPTTVIGMRATAGSANPADFLFPSLVATVLSTAIGIIGVKLCAIVFDRPKKRKNKSSELCAATPNATLPLSPAAALAPSAKPRREKSRTRKIRTRKEKQLKSARARGTAK